MSSMERFEILQEIGRGAQGITFLARDRELGQEVALKKLNLKDSVGWDVIELFERESRALQSLDHAGIPKYIDAFHLGGDGNTEESFILVQEYVAGQNLAELIAQGVRINEEQTRRFLQEMLEILKYLHELDPPVIHRDIKPSNIIRRLDGRWTLIDFGAAQSSVGAEGVMQELMTVGTTGYMPFEQILGRAVPASDLYALGATTVHLLSHQHPNDLPTDDAAYMQLLFKAHITATPLIVDLLESLLEPLAENRVQTARQALVIIAENKIERRDKPIGKLVKPAQAGRELMPGVMRVKADKVLFRLKRRGSAFGERGGIGRTFRFLIGCLFVLHAMVRVFYEGALYDVVLWGQVFGMLLYLVYRRRLRLMVTREDVRISSKWFWLWKKRVPLHEISDVSVVRFHTLLRRERGFMVEVRTRRGEVFCYGTGQTRKESEWLAFEIREAICKFSDSVVVVGALEKTHPRQETAKIKGAREDAKV